MTGRYAHNHGVKSNENPAEPGPEALDPDTTIQHALQEVGYRTALYGKYFNDVPLERSPPDFDDFAVMKGKYSDDEWNVNGTIRSIPGYTTSVITDKALEFLQSTERPFFMYLAPKAPHHPWTSEVAYAQASVRSWDGNPAVFERDRSDKPPYLRRSKAQLREGQSVRRAQVRTPMSVDAMVGTVMGKLHEQGIDQDTLLFFVSDNGLMWSEHGIQSWRKEVPYRQAVEVPMYARWPGHIAAGQDPRWAATIDIAPTIAEAAAVNLPHADGRSLLHAFRRDEILLEAWCNSEQTPCHRWASIRTRDLQFIEYYDRTGRVTFREYYDVDADPWQLENLLHNGDPSDDPQLSTLRVQLREMRSCAGPACP